MLSIFRKIINWFSLNIRAVAVGFISLLIATVLVLSHLLKERDKEINRITNNIKVYEDIVFSKELLNRVLLLTIDELNSSRDSLIQEVKDILKSLKIKDKNLTNVNVINTEIKDSVRTVIKHRLIDFKEELTINPLTTIIVSRKDSILLATLDIKNQLILFVEEKKEYCRLYKSALVRFFHFDWRRVKTKKYLIVNSNPIIKVTDTRVIELPK